MFCMWNAIVLKRHAELRRCARVVVALHQHPQEPDFVRRQVVVGVLRRRESLEQIRPRGAPLPATSGRRRSSLRVSPSRRRADGVFFSRYPHAPAHSASKMRVVVVVYGQDEHQQAWGSAP